MIESKERPFSIVVFMVLLLSIFPVVNFLGFTTPVLYFLIPFEGILFLMLLKNKTQPRVFYWVVGLFLLMCVEIALSTIVNTWVRLGNIMFPRDIIQYVARLLVFVTFFALAYHKRFSKERFACFFLIVMNLGMTIGILQWIPWAGRKFMILLYPFRDGSLQLSQLGRSLATLRMHGVAQHATANGGLAAFALLFGIITFFYLKKFRVLSALLVFLAAVNIFASQSRAGQLALVVSIVFFVLVNTLRSGNLKKSLKTGGLIFLGIGAITALLYFLGNPFIETMVYRWNDLMKNMGGGRVDQVLYFLRKMSHWTNILLGLSKQIVNLTHIPFGVEIEVINIFINYGVLGWILHYGLVLGLLLYFGKSIRNLKNSQAQYYAILGFITLVSYQVFSVAYFFFREIRVGLIPWILFGFAVGAIERARKEVIRS